MIRKQVYLALRHERMLKRRARQRGVTEAEVIRDMLDASEGALVGRSGPGPDSDAGRRLLSFIRSLGAARRGRRRWNREALYEDRIGRWTRS